MFPSTYEVGRACGRTYRRTLYAVLQASAGKKVLFVVGCSQERSQIIAKISKLTKGYASHSGHGLFEFQNGGSLLVHGLSTNFRGMRADIAVTDELLNASWREIEQYQKNINYAMKENGETV